MRKRRTAVMAHLHFSPALQCSVRSHSRLGPAVTCQHLHSAEPRRPAHPEAVFISSTPLLRLWVSTGFTEVTLPGSLVDFCFLAGSVALLTSFWPHGLLDSAAGWIPGAALSRRHGFPSAFHTALSAQDAKPSAYVSRLFEFNRSK